MKPLLRYLRLLPAVVIVGGGVLALKGVDIARAAQTAADAAAYAEPDNSGLAPTDTGGAPARDYASDGGTIASAAEVDVLSSLTRRRAELDARERALNMRENLLNAGEGRVDQKIAALTALQTQIQGLLAQRDAKQDAQIASLVKTYSAMKARDAAGIFNALDDDVLIPVAKGMKSDVLAPILAAMKPDAAQKLTVKLAALLKLPEGTSAAVCPVDASAPAPGATSDAAPPAGTAPVQTALANPPVTLTPPPAPPSTAVQPPPTATPPVQATPPREAPHPPATTTAASPPVTTSTAPAATPPAAPPGASLAPHPPTQTGAAAPPAAPPAATPPAATHG